MKDLLIVFLCVSFFHHLSFAGLAEENLDNTSENKLKVAYAGLSYENGDACYIPAFDRKDVVPSFAEPATFSEESPLPEPSFRRCSSEEEALISSYQDSALLLDDGIDLAGGGGALVGSLGIVCFATGLFSTVETFIRRDTRKDRAREEEKPFGPLRLFVTGGFTILGVVGGAAKGSAFMAGGYGAMFGATALVCGEAGRQYVVWYTS